jgi:hypothetical protein
LNNFLFHIYMVFLFIFLIFYLYSFWPIIKEKKRLSQNCHQLVVQIYHSSKIVTPSQFIRKKTNPHLLKKCFDYSKLFFFNQYLLFVESLTCKMTNKPYRKLKSYAIKKERCGWEWDMREISRYFFVEYPTHTRLYFFFKKLDTVCTFCNLFFIFKMNAGKCFYTYIKKNKC